jgi:hypothetical protein
VASCCRRMLFRVELHSLIISWNGTEQDIWINTFQKIINVYSCRV